MYLRSYTLRSVSNLILVIICQSLKIFNCVIFVPAICRPYEYIFWIITGYSTACHNLIFQAPKKASSYGRIRQVMVGSQQKMTKKASSYGRIVKLCPSSYGRRYCKCLKASQFLELKVLKL